MLFGFRWESPNDTQANEKRRQNHGGDLQLKYEKFVTLVVEIFLIVSDFSFYF